MYTVFNFFTSLSFLLHSILLVVGSQCCSPLDPVLDQELSAKRLPHHLELLKEYRTRTKGKQFISDTHVVIHV